MAPEPGATAMTAGAATVTTGGVVSITLIVTVSSEVTPNELATLLVITVEPSGKSYAPGPDTMMAVPLARTVSIWLDRSPSMGSVALGVYCAAVSTAPR
jgi:hypothetical protein